ncbi:hypothetical protein ACLESD_12235 [Pyxidicoccus sp. 3LFB2]
MGLTFLVTGGYFDVSGECVTWLVDLERERSEEFVRWMPPAHLRVAGKGFAGGCLAQDGSLYVASHCALVRIDVSRAVVSGVLHQPGFNDLHHVASSAGRLYIANTGLGTVDIHDLTGRFVGSHALLPGWVNHWRMAGGDPPDWETVIAPGWVGTEPARWPRRLDDDGYHDSSAYRHETPFSRLKVPDFLHPNHVCITAEQTLVTCMYDGTVRDLRTFEPVLRLPGAHPHDGLIDAGLFWTTSIDGRIHTAPLQMGRVSGEAEVRLRVFDSGHAGWCRGLWTDGRLLAVGLTEVRRGRMPRHRWAEREPEGTETSILLLDLSDKRLLARVELTHATRHSKLYSLLRVDGTP